MPGLGPDEGMCPRKLTIKRGKVVLASTPLDVPEMGRFCWPTSRYSEDQKKLMIDTLGKREEMKHDTTVHGAPSVEVQRKSNLTPLIRPQKRLKRSLLPSLRSPPLKEDDYLKEEQVNSLVGEAISESLCKAYDGLPKSLREFLKVADGSCTSTTFAKDRKASTDRSQALHIEVQGSGSRTVTSSREAEYRGLGPRVDLKQEKGTCKHATRQQSARGGRATKKTDLDLSAIKFASITALPYSAFDPGATTKHRLSVPKRKPKTTVAVTEKEITSPRKPSTQKNILVFAARTTTRARLENYIASSEDLELDMIFPQIQDKLFSASRLRALDCVSSHGSKLPTAPVSIAEKRPTLRFPPRTGSRHQTRPADSKAGLRHHRTTSLDSAISRVPSLHGRFKNSVPSSRSGRTSAASDVLPIRTSSLSPRSTRPVTAKHRTRRSDPVEPSSHQQGSRPKTYDPEYLKTKALPLPPPLALESADI